MRYSAIDSTAPRTEQRLPSSTASLHPSTPASVVTRRNCQRGAYVEEVEGTDGTRSAISAAAANLRCHRRRRRHAAGVFSLDLRLAVSGELLRCDAAEQHFGDVVQWNTSTCW